MYGELVFFSPFYYYFIFPSDIQHSQEQTDCIKSFFLSIKVAITERRLLAHVQIKIATERQLAKQTDYDAYVGCK